MLNLSKVLLSVFFSASVMAATPVEVAQQQSIEAYSNLVYKTYSESLKSALTLQSDLKNFVKNPGVLTHEIAKKSWKLARAPYGQSEVFRFYNGPIDMDNGPEGSLNAWPLDEAYIDYVVGAPQAGIINDLETYPVINEELLKSLNELDGEKNISTGYHAIEFLLWGQDMFADSAGRRTYEDYVDGKTLNAKRRGEYLITVSNILIEDLQSLVDAWAPNTKGNFRSAFVSQKQTSAFKNILSGVIYMTGDELSGERMYVAYETQGQEDEHSCFSDMTHMDIQWNFWGVENILRETKILELPALKNTEIAKAVLARIAKINVMNAAIPVPFDQAILSEDGREKILAAIEEMEALAKDLVIVSEKLGAKVDF